ncbi:MAG: ABC transporter substrate-binding protein [Spirochaetes bacterium]|uniref:ABC transporter substrate-binding protein n=1 Tax=Candidatus Aphodenecus pullistercoris TaxID=2840669 RepID=A0A9D9E8H0_9SPIR|nr:ABC transporter substrate-binding protein [Candidatus Aphodenecus pullistercoris]
MHRKLTLVLTVLALCAGLFAQPASEAVTSDATPVRVAALKGPTAMGLVQLMDESGAGTVDGNDYSFSIVASPTEMTPMIVRGEVDIAALPANLASVLYNNTDGGVQVLAVNTLGVLYIVQHGDDVSSVQDLAGKTIYASGKGSTPEYALSYILEEAGLADSVTVEWKSEHAECVAAIVNDSDAVALLPQPFVTTAMMQDPSIRVALDLNDAWAEVSPDSALITGVIVARTAFVEANGEAVDSFLTQYKESTDYANSDVAGAAALVGKYDIVPEAVALKALPECNIVCITGDEMEADLSSYLTVLYEANPASVGGALPAEDFYY